MKLHKQYYLYIILFHGNEINDADAVVVGYVWDADLFEKAIFSRYDYNYATKTFEYSGQYWEKTNIGTVHDNMIWVTFEAKDYGKTLKPDSIIHAEFVPNTTDFSNVHADFYIRSPYTNITNGVLNVDNTFSGDYAIINNNDKNTDKIINNDNSLYDKMFYISGDKIDGILQEAIQKIEIESRRTR